LETVAGPMDLEKEIVTLLGLEPGQLGPRSYNPVAIRNEML